MHEILSNLMMFITSSYYAGFYDIHRQAFADYVENWLIARMSSM